MVCRARILVKLALQELAWFCASNGFGLPLHLCLCCYDPVKCGVNLTYRGIFYFYTTFGKFVHMMFPTWWMLIFLEDTTYLERTGISHPAWFTQCYSILEGFWRNSISQQKSGSTNSLSKIIICCCGCGEGVWRCPKRVGSFGYDTGFLFLMRKERQREVI